MMPPAMFSDSSDRCSHCRNVRPPSMNPTRITYAAAHSRSTTRRWRSGGTFFSAETTSGTLPNGSMTRISRTVAEKSSAFIRE